MKLLDASQLSSLDVATCEEQGITSWELMERASKLAYNFILETYELSHKSIKIFAGTGNNGGDALAIARFLISDGYAVKVYPVDFSDSRSSDNRKNLKLLKKEKDPFIQSLDEASELPKINENDICIDAIFGVGLNRSMPLWVQNLVQHINIYSKHTIALDVPSGMFLHKSPAKSDQVIKAHLTLTFHAPKLSFYLPDYKATAGKIQILDISLSQNYLKYISSEICLVNLKFAQLIYQPKMRFSHKGTNGHAVLIGGSRYMLGSIMLAAKSCMRSGVGKLSVMMPNKGHLALLQHLPEAMLLENTSIDYISFKDLDFKYDAVGVGVGIGTSNDVLNALKLWLETATCPLVIDADALNLISKHKILQKKIPKKSILTPHPGELKRLIGDWKDDFDKIKKLKDFSMKLDVIIVAKDAFTLTIYKDMVYVNSTGNAGMATAGSGDVLTGLLTGLLAQGYSSPDASILGVFLHGLAGDLAKDSYSEQSLIASDIITNLGSSFSKLILSN